MLRIVNIQEVMGSYRGDIVDVSAGKTLGTVALDEDFARHAFTLSGDELTKFTTIEEGYEQCYLQYLH